MDEAGQGIDLGIPGIGAAVEVGRGGFGVVYRAYQPRLERTVAVKVLPPCPDAQARERFERECRAVGALSGHPNIVTVFDSGFTESRQPYLVMEYMPDGSLADRVHRDGALPWREAIAIGVKLAGAVEMAHRNGVLHRDVKPENVLVSSYGEPCLTDFGLARLQGGTQSRTGAVTTSLAHAAPEVIEGHRPSEAADIYSVASTVFELMTGAPAFVRDTDETLIPVLARIASAPVPDLRPEGVPAGVCNTLEQAMAKEPNARPRSAGELGAALQAAQRATGAEVADMQLVDVAPASIEPLEADRPGSGPVRTLAFQRSHRDTPTPPPSPENAGFAATLSETPEIREPRPTDSDDVPFAAAAVSSSFSTTSPNLGPATRHADDVTPVATAPPSADGRRSRAFVLGGVAVLVVVAAVAALLVFNSGGGDQKAASGSGGVKPGMARGHLQFAAVTLASGMKVNRSWHLAGDKGDTLTTKLKVTNPSDKALAGEYIEVVPKELASNVKQIHFEGTTPETVVADPVVRYRLSIPARKTETLRFRITVPAEGTGTDRLDSWKDAWTSAKTAFEKFVASAATAATTPTTAAPVVVPGGGGVPSGGSPKSGGTNNPGNTPTPTAAPVAPPSVDGIEGLRCVQYNPGGQGGYWYTAHVSGAINYVAFQLSGGSLDYRNPAYFNFNYHGYDTLTAWAVGPGGNDSLSINIYVAYATENCPS